jgi:hypothetical protein
MTATRNQRAGVYALVRSGAPDDATKTIRSAVYALATGPAENTFAQRSGVYVIGRDPNPEIDIQRGGVYCLCRHNPEEQLLRAWRFPQDDHEFYVVHLYDITLVYDKLTGAWSQWTSDDASYWKGADGCDWEGINVCCDVLTGKIWQIDADNRLDYGTTPIVSLVVGGLTERFRNTVPCFMAEVALSEGAPPDGVSSSAVGIGLRTSDDNGTTWFNHGLITGDVIGTDQTVRFYGLGTMTKPGRIFEITDTGYARRIDGLNIETGNYGASPD